MTWQLGMTLDMVEKEIIYEALKAFQGSKVHAASALGISLKTIYNKLEAYEKNESVHSATGIRVEPIVQDTTQQPVPVQVGEKVQEMPPASAKGMRHDRKR